MKQTQLMTVDDCSGLSDDELRDMANTFGEKCQQAAKKTVEDAITAGTALLAMKARVQHGEWLKWLGSNWDYDPRTAQTYMTLSSNRKRFVFENVGSIRDAMSMIAAQQTEEAAQETPRAERKTGRVEVVKPDEDPSGQKSVQPDENAVPAEPKTNTKHRPETAKAKEADRKPPAAITPEIIDEPEDTGPTDAVEAYLDVVSPVQVVRDTLTRITDKVLQVKEVRRIRKELDKFDPPVFGAPSVEAVHEWAAGRGIKDFDANKFFNHYELSGWKYGKTKTPIKDWERAAANAYSDGKGWAVDGANRLPF